MDRALLEWRSLFFSVSLSIVIDRREPHQNDPRNRGKKKQKQENTREKRNEQQFWADRSSPKRPARRQQLEGDRERERERCDGTQVEGVGWFVGIFCISCCFPLGAQMGTLGLALGPDRPKEECAPCVEDEISIENHYRVAAR